MSLKTERWILETGKKAAYIALVPGLTGMVYSFSNPQPLVDILPSQIRENAAAILIGSIGVSGIASFALIAINKRLSEIEGRTSDVQHTH